MNIRQPRDLVIDDAFGDDNDHDNDQDYDYDGGDHHNNDKVRPLHSPVSSMNIRQPRDLVIGEMMTTMTAMMMMTK